MLVTIVSGLQVSASSSADVGPETSSLSRRSLLQAGAAAALTAPALGFPFIRNAKAAELELNSHATAPLPGSVSAAHPAGRYTP